MNDCYPNDRNKFYFSQFFFFSLKNISGQFFGLSCRNSNGVWLKPQAFTAFASSTKLILRLRRAPVHHKMTYSLANYSHPGAFFLIMYPSLRYIKYKYSNLGSYNYVELLYAAGCVYRALKICGCSVNYSFGEVLKFIFTRPRIGVIFLFIFC